TARPPDRRLWFFRSLPPPCAAPVWPSPRPPPHAPDRARPRPFCGLEQVRPRALARLLVQRAFTRQQTALALGHIIEPALELGGPLAGGGLGGIQRHGPRLLLPRPRFNRGEQG